MNFDLNIDKYNVNDMLHIFNIENNDKLNKIMLDNQYNNLIIGINDSDLSINDKNNMQSFLFKIYNKLLILVNHEDSRLINKPKIFSKTYNVSDHHIIEPNNNNIKHLNHINKIDVCNLLNINTR